MIFENVTSISSNFCNVSDPFNDKSKCWSNKSNLFPQVLRRHRRLKVTARDLQYILDSL